MLTKIHGQNTSSHQQVQMTSHSPRLFEVSNATGNLVWEEIFDFDQDDMDEDDVMVLDTFDTIYIWVGNGARKDEKLGTVQEISVSY